MAGATAADVVRGLPEVEALALVIWGEARAETPDGQIAVGQVILHRLRSGKWGHTVNEVVCAKSQFSCLWPFGGRDNHERVKATADALARGEAVASESFRQCRWIAQGLLDGMVIRDLVKGAMNYLTTDLLGSGLAPKWATTMDVTAKIGHHVFGRAVLVLCAVLLAATAASAQVVNPRYIEFTSADHTSVTRYEIGYFLVGAAAPVQTVSVPKAEFDAQPDAYWRHTLPRPVFGTFVAKAQAFAPAVPSGEVGSGWSAAQSDPFSLFPLAPAGLRTPQ